MSRALTILPSAARTTTQTSAGVANAGGSAVVLVVDVTVAGTGSITASVVGVDIASGKTWPILTGLPITTISTNIYKIGAGLAVAANVSTNDLLPGRWQVIITANNANSMTYSVGASVVG